MNSYKINKTCIIIAGPTASGKTDLAIKVAKHFHTEIISADSRQCFKELNIGVAKPTIAQLADVKHHFINSHSIQAKVTVADFETYALDALENIFKKNDIAVVCGGTGLYIKAFTDGLDDITEASAEVKNEIALGYHQHGITWLQQKIQALDPLFWAEGEVQNPHRLLRALEVFITTGKSIITLQKGEKKQRPFNIIKIGLTLPRHVLYNRINGRVDAMQATGLEDEAKSLLPFKSLNALQTVGYKELFQYFEGEISQERAFELIKQNSRHYAKRQLTWFKKDDEFMWLTQEEVVPYLENCIKK
ncbi:MAG: tRNA (adenosine(37)-N6)-dimethylallyltransferase MiaA [Ferruginibacter sp.]